LQRPDKSLLVRPKGPGFDSPCRMPAASHPRGESLASEAPQRSLLTLTQVSASTSQHLPCPAHRCSARARPDDEDSRRSVRARQARAMTAVLAAAKVATNAMPVR